MLGDKIKLENNYFVFIALLLVIITIGGGAVSASQDNLTYDELIVNEKTNTEIISENLNDEKYNQISNKEDSYESNNSVLRLNNANEYNRNLNYDNTSKLTVNFNHRIYEETSHMPAAGSNSHSKSQPIEVNKHNYIFSKNKKLKVAFFKNNGEQFAKKQVKYKINGKLYKAKTNSKGSLYISLKKFKMGSNKLVCYKKGYSKSFKIKIFKRKISTKLYSNSHTYFINQTQPLSAKFKTALGENSAAGKTIKIKANGKTYSRVTDKNGMIYLNIPFKKGINTIVYKYPGSKNFKSSKTTSQIKIFDTRNTKLKVTGTKSFGHGANTPLTIQYTAGGIGLAKKLVIITIKGKDYIRTTDNDGKVYLPITLGLGNYKVHYKTNNDNMVNGTSGECDINVFKRSPSKIIWKSGRTFKDNLQKYKVLVKNKKGKKVSGGDIQLTIDSIPYYSKVSSKGLAKFKTSVEIGKYKVKVKFKGNNEYLESSISKKVKVKLSYFKNGVNEKNGAGSGGYLKSSSHCPVGNSKIKALVKSLTSVESNKVNKAKKIFHYVRDNVEYSYYYNTHKGAVKTLKDKKGNCADQAHLLVAMYRTAGFKARYVHGTCHFSDGDVTGHVWTQVKIGKNWVCGDPINPKNSLGKVKNWNTKSYSLHGKHTSLPF